MARDDHLPPDRGSDDRPAVTASRQDVDDDPGLLLAEDGESEAWLASTQYVDLRHDE